MKNILHISLIFLFTFPGIIATGQEKEFVSLPIVSSGKEAGMLTLEDIFEGNKFKSERMGDMEWYEDGSSFTALEESADGAGQELVKYHTKSGKREIIVTADELVPEGKTDSVDEYSWSPDGKSLLLFMNTSRVWRYNTKGDYWVLDMQTRKLKQIGTFADPSNLKFAKFSPDGNRIAYVYYNNIYVEDIATGKVTQLTHNGSETLINGTFDWVYEEEFSCRDGFRWSPDGRHIAYWQMDASVIREFYMINNTDSLYPYIIPIPYPKVGQKLSECRVGVMRSTGGGKTVWMKTDPDLRNNYIPRMEWAANSREIVIQYMNRLQNQNRVMLGDIGTGIVKTIFTDTDEAWLDVVDDFIWLEEGRYFTWTSQRSGWNHLYKVSREGGSIIPVTKGDYEVISVELIDEKGGYVYYIASPDNPTERYLYRAKLSGGEPEKLSPDMKGHHSYNISPDGKWAVHTFSDFETPATVDLVSLPKHKSQRILVDNAEIKAALAEVKTSRSEFLRIDIGEVELDGWMMKPWNFDPSKKYPVLIFVYGEPAGSTVQNSYGRRSMWNHYLTQQGYIVMSFDNRGANTPRGREWRKAIYKKIGIVNAADQAAAAREIGKWDFIDENRIAIWGWSGGGSSTLNALLQYPDVYHTGISVAPVPDQLLYDAVYQERYMQTPDLNPEGLKNGSPITHAKNLRGNLLVIHGTGDDNVHYQGMEKLVNEFIRHNRQFDMMSYPNRSHSIREGEGTTLHLYTLMTRYLMEKMPPGE